MPSVVPIVEGDGEVDAVPILLRRLLEASHRWDIRIAHPKNAHGKGNLTKENGLERFLHYAAKESDCGAILVLLDADEECAKELAESLASRAAEEGLAFPVTIIAAVRHFENWFLASLQTVVPVLGLRSLGSGVDLQFDVDNVEDESAKGWLDRHMAPGRAYKETVDQARLTACLDLSQVQQKSRSFRRLVHAFDELVEAMDNGTAIVSPAACQSPQAP